METQSSTLVYYHSTDNPALDLVCDYCKSHLRYDPVMYAFYCDKCKAYGATMIELRNLSFVVCSN